MIKGKGDQSLSFDKIWTISMGILMKGLSPNKPPPFESSCEHNISKLDFFDIILVTCSESRSPAISPDGSEFSRPEAMRPGNLYAKNGKNAEQSTLSSESKWWYNHRLKAGKLAKSFSVVMSTMAKILNLALGIVRQIMVAGEV